MLQPRQLSRGVRAGPGSSLCASCTEVLLGFVCTRRGGLWVCLFSFFCPNCKIPFSLHGGFLWLKDSRPWLCKVSDKNSPDTTFYLPSRPSRRSPQKQTRHFLTLMNLKPAEVETKAVLASGRYREEAAETTPSWPPMPVMIVLFAMVMFVIFMRVINGC